MWEALPAILNEQSPFLLPNLLSLGENSLFPLKLPLDCGMLPFLAFLDKPSQSSPSTNPQLFTDTHYINPSGQAPCFLSS